jgi:hypothetical protein
LNEEPWPRKSSLIKTRMGSVSRRRSDGRCRTAEGGAIDVARATWSNTIGYCERVAVCKAPHFDHRQWAVYYAHVIEIPTPRWTAQEAALYGITMPDDVPKNMQERANASLIWCTP